MNIFLVNVKDGDYHRLIGVDLLMVDDRVHIFLAETADKIPELYAEIISRSKADILIEKITDDADSGISANAENGLFRIGHDVSYGWDKVYSSVLEAIYLSWHDGSMERPVDLDIIERRVSENASLRHIADDCQLDIDILMRIVSADENDKRRLYQDLLHEFGNRKGTLAYQKMKENGVMMFRKQEKPLTDMRKFMYRYQQYYIPGLFTDLEK